MTQNTQATWAPAPRPGLVPLYPYGFGTILGKAFAVLKGNPKVLLLFVVGVQTLSMALSTAIIFAVTFLAMGRLDTVSPTSPEFEDIFAGSVLIILLVTVAVSLALTGVSVIAHGFIVAEVAHASLAEKARLGTLWRRVRPAFWRLIGLSLLISVGVMIAIALVAVPLVLLALANTAASWIGFGVGLLFAGLGSLVLAAWIGTKLYLSTSAIVLEGAGPIRAIGRSWKLTRGRFWSTFGVVVLLSLITQFVAGIISGVVSMFTPLITTILVPLSTSTGDLTAASVIGALVFILSMVLSFAVAAIMTIVTGAGGTLAYIDARMRDEGIDLRMRQYVEAGGAAEDPYTFVPDAQPSPYAAPQRPSSPQGGPYGYPNQPQGYPQAYPQPQYPQQPQAYPPQQQAYPPQPQAYPPQQQPYPPQQPQAFPPQQQPYPPQQPQASPPQQPSPPAQDGDQQPPFAPPS